MPSDSGASRPTDAEIALARRVERQSFAPALPGVAGLRFLQPKGWRLAALDRSPALRPREPTEFVRWTDTSRSCVIAFAAMACPRVTTAERLLLALMGDRPVDDVVFAGDGPRRAMLRAVLPEEEPGRGQRVLWIRAALRPRLALLGIGSCPRARDGQLGPLIEAVLGSLEADAADPHDPVLGVDAPIEPEVGHTVAGVLSLRLPESWVPARPPLTPRQVSGQDFALDVDGAMAALLRVRFSTQALSADEQVEMLLAPFGRDAAIALGPVIEETRPGDLPGLTDVRLAWRMGSRRGAAPEDDTPVEAWVLDGAVPSPTGGRPDAGARVQLALVAIDRRTDAFRWAWGRTGLDVAAETLRVRWP
jgi:hypothetical protein